MFQSIVVAIDSSRGSEYALDAAAELSRLTKGTLTIVTVIPPVPTLSTPVVEFSFSPLDMNEVTQAIQQVLVRFQDRAKADGAGTVQTEIIEGPVVDALVDYADKHRPDLVVLGGRGMGTARRLLLGSVSDALVHHLSCPVLIVKEPHAKKG